MSSRPPTVVIENVNPLIDGGRYPVKRCSGEDLTVEADIFKDGHDVVSAILKWRKAGEAAWHETPMTPVPWGMDRWRGQCAFFEQGFWEVTIEAWGDTFRSWQHEFQAKHEARQADLASETLEGQHLERIADIAHQVVGLHERVVFAAQQVLEQDLERERQALDAGECRGQGRQAEEVVGLATRGQGHAGLEGIAAGHVARILTCPQLTAPGRRPSNARGTPMRELLLGFRQWKRTPGLAVAAILSIGLGVGPCPGGHRYC